MILFFALYKYRIIFYTLQGKCLYLNLNKITTDTIDYYEFIMSHNLNVYILEPLSQNFEKLLLASSYLSVRLSVWNKTAFHETPF